MIKITEGSPRVSFEEFVKRAKGIHGDKFEYDETSFDGMNNKTTIICPIHGPFPQTPKRHVLGQGCPKCGGVAKKTTEDFIEQAKKKFGNKFDYSKVRYVDTDTPVEITCPTHGKFEQTPYHHLKSKMGCPFEGTARQNTKLFIDKAKKVHGDFYDYSKVDYKNKDSKVLITCPLHGDFEQHAGSHLRGIGCAECSGKKQSTTESFVEKAKLKHGEKYDYSLVNYVNAKVPVNIICKKHGTFSQKPNNHLNGAGCPICNESKGENLINSILVNFNLEFIRQHKFEDCTNTLKGKKCRRLPFDFYLPSKKIAIEYDGQQHFLPVWGDIGLEKIKKTDRLKNIYCKKNNIKLIRIPYTMSPEEIETYLLMELGLTD